MGEVMVVVGEVMQAEPAMQLVPRQEPGNKKQETSNSVSYPSSPRPLVPRLQPGDALPGGSCLHIHPANRKPIKPRLALLVREDLACESFHDSTRMWHNHFTVLLPH